MRSISERSVPYRLCETYSTHSRKAPSSTRAVNSSSVRNQYSRPSPRPGRCGRVVAEIATSSSGTRSRSARISVPLPRRPTGPVTTKTGLTASTAGIPSAGGAGDHLLLKRLTSSARWRSESPPTVFDWLIRHWFSSRAALTRPNFGTAISMSNTFAVET